MKKGKVELDVISSQMYMLDVLRIKEEKVITLVNTYDGSILSYLELEELHRNIGISLELLEPEKVDAFNESKKKMAYEEWLAWNEGYYEIKEPKKRKSPIKRGYVYLIKEHFTHTYKIGRAVDVASRGNIFTVKLPFDWDFIATIETDDYIYLEEYLHSRFKDKRVNGEWFNLDEEDVAYITKGILDDTLTSNFELKVSVG